MRTPTAEQIQGWKDNHSRIQEERMITPQEQFLIFVTICLKYDIPLYFSEDMTKCKMPPLPGEFW